MRYDAPVTPGAALEFALKLEQRLHLGWWLVTKGWIMVELGAGRAYLALPESGTGKGILLLHAWWGLTDFFTALADRLASEGFVVLAPDMFGGATAATIEEAEALRSAAEGDTAAEMALAGVDYLKAHPAVTSAELGVIGFSFGAAYSLWLATYLPDAIGALVVFYGTYEGLDMSPMRAAFLGHFAENDEYEPREGVEALDKALTDLKLDATFYVYEGTGHWFFEADRPAYHPESARLAWEWTVKFLNEKLA